MRYIIQFCCILLFCLLGELLHYFLPFPIPSSIYGMVLLLCALRSNLLKPEQVRDTALFLVGIFPFLFIPAAAGVMEVQDELFDMLLPVFLALFVVTALVMAISGYVTQYIMDRQRRTPHD